ncbi:UDP-4-amino-4,6-dideoxy-N-acetyl-beta-L-altrosamine transaminase, partial [Candidatus Marinamargulisbacteria bacterium SCGC AG-439-L15]
MSILFHKAHITDEEINEVVDTLKSGWLTMGPKTIAFEKAIQDYLDVPFAVSTNSATAALHLSLKAMGLKASDEVIIPTTTFISTAEVVTYFNAIPVLCDIDEKTHCMDVTKIEPLITEKTRAIIPVHFAGIPCDMDAIMAIAKKHSLIVIEDAAHSMPSSYKGRKIGTVADMTCFSFYATKTLATGEGGMVTTANEVYAKHIQCNRLHGLSKDAWNRYSDKGSWYYEVVDNGYKYNMTDIAASLGLVQLKKVEWMRDERQKIADFYDNAFESSSIETLCVPDDVQTAWHLYVIKINNREELMTKLKEAGIHTSVHFIPVHKHPYYKDTFGY